MQVLSLCNHNCSQQSETRRMAFTRSQFRLSLQESGGETQIYPCQ
ncbi:hypothetical protein CV83915_1p0108 (plasmid) [Escherichia coli]|uniref:Uncharacterized protein n=1 Tax=Escherichia coli TaxID=562 RepID=A0A2H4TK97_ECOLX|nr:hypothetical protein CV83915_1p0108 [Escherichia coli]